MKVLEQDDLSTFFCHKTVDYSREVTGFDDETYSPSGDEFICAGAVGYLWKIKNPNVYMRVLISMGVYTVEELDALATEVRDLP